MHRLQQFAVLILFLSSASAQPYTWNNVKIVAGGFITGINMHPAEKGLMYTRTDIGGAYRWDVDNARWIPLIDWVSPDESNLLGVESIGLDPTNPDRLYLALGTYTQSWAGTGAIVRSTDRGATFLRTNLPIKLGGNEDGRFAGERLVVDPLNPSTIYFGSRKDGLWVSTDYAVTWAKVKSFPADSSTNGIGIVSVAFDSVNPGANGGPETIYVAVSSPANHLFRSNDSGSTWEPVPGQTTGLLPNHAVLSPDGLLYLTYGNQPGPNGMTTGAVRRYNPLDGSWADLTPQPARGQLTWGFGNISIDASNPKSMVVSTMDRWGPIDDIFRSTDGGVNWNSMSAGAKLDISLSPWLTFGGTAPKFGWWMGALAIDPFDSNHVLFGTGATIYATNDGTNTDTGSVVHWSVGAAGVEETAVLQLLSPPSGANLLSGLGDIGGFVHDDLNVSPPRGMWTNPVFSTTNGMDFAELNPLFVVRVGSGSRHGAYSTDGGYTWKPFGSDAAGVASGPGSIAVATDATALVWSPTSGNVSYSTDQGATWTASQGAPSRQMVTADRVNPAKFYIFDPSTGTALTSTDGGATFSPAATGLPHNGGAIRPVPGIEGDLWLAQGGGLFHSTDSGASFTRVTSAQTGVAIGFGKSATDGGYPALYLSGRVNGVMAIYQSIDAGASWTRINDDAHQYGWIGTITGDPRIFGRVYIGSNGRGIVYGDPIPPPDSSLSTARQQSRPHK